MKRREFLKYSMAALGAFADPLVFAPSLRAKTSGSLTMTIISDITPDVSVPHLRAVLAAFQEQSLPVTCVVHPLCKMQDSAAAPCPLPQAIADILSFGKGLIEIIGYMPSLAQQSPYFQARAAFDMRKVMSDQMKSYDIDMSRMDVLQSVACEDSPNPTSPEGIRSAGVRNILMISSKSKPVETEAWNNGTVRIYGGSRLNLAFWSKGRSDEEVPKGTTINLFSASQFPLLSVDKVYEIASQYARNTIDQEVAGITSNLLLADLQLRDNYGFRKIFGLELLVDPVVFHYKPEALTDLQAQLNILHIPFSTRIQAPKNFNSEINGYWVINESATGKMPGNTGASSVILSPNCHLSQAHIQRSGAPLGPGLGVFFADSAESTQGIDACGHLNFRSIMLDKSGDLVQHLSGVADAFLLLPVDKTTTRWDYKPLIRELTRLKQNEVIEFLTVETYAKRIAPRSPQLSRLRLMLASQSKNAAKLDQLTESQRQAYLEDAHIAWSYLEKFTNPKTGLCPATVNFSKVGGRKHQTITMWDAGSHICGLVAATEIGIISKKDLIQRIEKILPNLKGRTSQGRLLPQGWIRTDRFKWGNKDFDGCDCGRLLAAFAVLDKFLGKSEALEKLVSSWDLEKIVIDGVIHSVKRGELASAFNSFCAHYSALSFRYWGVEVASPIEYLKGNSAFDGQMKILEKASDFGVLGAEPLLLEAIELGMSPESSFLADILFSAQVEEHEQSGRLVCVSEGPMDSAPWFTYQGLQLGKAERAWDVDTVDGVNFASAQEMKARGAAISSKAAFLWAAYHPHEYSDLLIEFVRGKARLAVGFAPTISENDDEATSAYSDLNTNCIILQSIAHILRQDGQTPSSK